MTDFQAVSYREPSPEERLNSLISQIKTGDHSVGNLMLITGGVIRIDSSDEILIDHEFLTPEFIAYLDSIGITVGKAEIAAICG